MGVARRGLDLRVTKQFPDHRQGLAERQRPAGKAMPKVMDSNILKTRFLPHSAPIGGEVPYARSRPASRDDPGIVRCAGKARENPCRRRRQGNHPGTSLAVAKPDLARLQVHVPPSAMSGSRLSGIPSASRGATPPPRAPATGLRPPTRPPPSRGGGTLAASGKRSSLRRLYLATKRQGLLPAEARPQASARLSI